VPDVPRVEGIPGRHWFFFDRLDYNEPMHVHVRLERKCWLVSFSMAWNSGYSAPDSNEIRRLVMVHEQSITETWHAQCGQR